MGNTLVERLGHKIEIDHHIVCLEKKTQHSKSMLETLDFFT
jgi:hypothetical protein